jgi:hypothetical protein
VVIYTNKLGFLKHPLYLFFAILPPSPAGFSTKKSLSCSGSRSMPEAEGQGVRAETLPIIDVVNVLVD